MTCYVNLPAGYQADSSGLAPAPPPPPQPPSPQPPPPPPPRSESPAASGSGGSNSGICCPLLSDSAVSSSTSTTSSSSSFSFSSSLSSPLESAAATAATPPQNNTNIDEPIRTDPFGELQNPQQLRPPPVVDSRTTTARTMLLDPRLQPQQWQLHHQQQHHPQPPPPPQQQQQQPSSQQQQPHQPQQQQHQQQQHTQPTQPTSQQQQHQHQATPKLSPPQTTQPVPQHILNMAPMQKEKENVQNQPNFEVRFVSTITSSSTTNSMVLKKSASPTSSVSTTSSTTTTSSTLTTTTTGRQLDGGTLQQQSIIKGGQQETGRNRVSTGDSSNSPIVPPSQTHSDHSDVSSVAPGSKVIAHHVKKRLLSCQRMLRLEAEETTKKQPQLLSPAKDSGKSTGSSCSASTLSPLQEVAPTTSASDQPKQSRSEYDFPDSPDDEEPISRTSTTRYLSFSSPGLKWSSADNAQSDSSSDSKMASSATVDTSLSTEVSASSPVVSRSSLGKTDQPRLTPVETHSNLPLFSTGKESLPRENISRGEKGIATSNNCNNLSPSPSCVSTNDDVHNLQGRADIVTPDKALKTDFAEDNVAATTTTTTTTTVTSSFQLQHSPRPT